MDSVGIKEFKINSINNELIYKFNQNDTAINKIIITFDQNMYKLEKAKEGEVYLTFKNENELLNLISIFFQYISKQKKISQNVKFVFIIRENNKELEIKNVQMLVNTIGLKNYELHELTKQPELFNQLENQKTNEQVIEEQQKLVTNETTQISKQDMNNETKNYVKVDNQIYDDNDYLNINEKKQILLQEWLNDPIKKAVIPTLSKEELDKELTRVVTSKQKQYNLSSPHNDKTTTKVASTSNEIAKTNDGKVNEELGIVDNSATMSNQFTVVEEKRNNDIQVVSPTVTNQTINGTVSNETSSITNSNTGTSNSNLGDYNMNTTSDEIESRELETIYYIDDSNNIYNSKGENIGSLGPQSGYYIDMNNNLVKDNQVLGTIENLRDMKEQKEKSNVKKRVYKPDGYISFMLISIVLSLIFLVYIVITLV